MHISVSLLPPFLRESFVCQRAVTALGVLLLASLPSPHPPRTQAMPGKGAGAGVCLSAAGPSPLPVFPSCSPLVLEGLLDPRYCLRALALVKDAAHGKFELLLINDHCAKWHSFLTLDSLWV